MIREVLLNLMAMIVIVSIGAATPVLAQPSSAAEGQAEAPADEGRVESDEEDSDDDKPLKPGAWLGVQLIDSPQDVRIGAVVIGSPAFKAGLRPGDSIVSVNGEKSDSAIGFVRAIGKLTAGDKVKLELDRNGERMELAITLAKPGDSFGRGRPPFWGPRADLPAELERMRRRIDGLERQVESLRQEIAALRDQR